MSGLARLSSDGARVLCVMVDCGMTLALIMEPNKQPINGLLDQEECFLWLPAGWWRRADGVWSVTRAARYRLRHGKPAMMEPDLRVGWIPRHDPEVICYACGMRQRIVRAKLGLPPSSLSIMDVGLHGAKYRPLMEDEFRQRHSDLLRF